MAKIVKANEYGQVELNQVAFRRDGRIIAQYKLADGIEYVENGMILAVNYATKTVGMPTKDQTTNIALNYTSEHMYDERLAGALKHFRLDNGTFCPRLGLLSTGDRFTTNTVDCGDLSTIAAALGTTKYYGHTSTNGYITVDTTATNAILEVIEVTTMPDGNPAIKFVVL